MIWSQLTLLRPTSPAPATGPPPPNDYVKINFDGASKGNPGPSGYGAVIRNSKGKILAMTAGHLGETTNNVAELTGLLQGLHVAISLPSHNIILEGDSQVILHLITRILHGSNPQTISPSWRLASLLEDFNNLRSRSLNIIPSHVKRKSNGVADYLANEVVQRELERTIWKAQSSAASDILQHCQHLADKDFLPPDGVPSGQSEHVEEQLGHVEVPTGRTIKEAPPLGCGQLIPTPASVNTES